MTVDFDEEHDGALLDRMGIDAAKWAAEFVKVANALGYKDIDEHWVIGWFANAIEAGREAGLAALPPAPHGGAKAEIVEDAIRAYDGAADEAYLHEKPHKAHADGVRAAIQWYLDYAPLSPPQEQEAAPKCEAKGWWWERRVKMASVDGWVERWVSDGSMFKPHASPDIRNVTPLYPASAAPKGEAVAWIEGVPPKPWCDEWFIAQTTFNDRVVLTALPEEYAYDFKTADDTYIKADKIKRWMQFPDSEYVAPPSPKAEPEQEAVRAELVVTPEMIAAAWQVMKRHHMPKLGSGPAFKEAIEAAIRARGQRAPETPE